METSALIKSLVREGQLLAAAADAAGPGALVPTCPGWRMRDLLRHTGTVHRWAMSFVTEGHTAYRPDAGEPDLGGDALLAWFREGHGLLVAALSEAPADLACWSFLPAPSPPAFWARRQAHETAVHRADAESASDGKPGPVAAEFAVDGIDELLAAFHARRKSGVRTATPKVLRVAATDTGDVWTVRLSQEPARTRRRGSVRLRAERVGGAALPDALEQAAPGRRVRHRRCGTRPPVTRDLGYHLTVGATAGRGPSPDHPGAPSRWVNAGPSAGTRALRPVTRACAGGETAVTVPRSQGATELSPSRPAACATAPRAAAASPRHGARGPPG